MPPAPAGEIVGNTCPPSCPELPMPGPAHSSSVSETPGHGGRDHAPVPGQPFLRVGEGHQTQAGVDQEPAQGFGFPAARPVVHPRQRGDRVVVAEDQRGEGATGEVGRADAVADVAARPTRAVGAQPDPGVPVPRDSQRAAPGVAEVGRPQLGEQLAGSFAQPVEDARGRGRKRGSMRERQW